MSSSIEKPIRVRFAPSPTGYLHVGGARTALYNWLLARKSSENRLVLRLEDTDRERSTDEAVAQILEALEWLELDWDEGPIRQTERSERYAERLAQLLDSGEAYWDVATADDVRRAKEKAGGAGYRGTPVAEGTPGAAVRLRVPDEGETVIQCADLLRANTVTENRPSSTLCPGVRGSTSSVISIESPGTTIGDSGGDG